MRSGRGHAPAASANRSVRTGPHLRGCPAWRRTGPIKQAGSRWLSQPSTSAPPVSKRDIHPSHRPSRPGDPPRGRQHVPERARVMPLPGDPVHPAEKLPGLQERRHRAPLLARERACSSAGGPEQRHPQPRAERRERRR